jgi:hypothetical protein
MLPTKKNKKVGGILLYILKETNKIPKPLEFIFYFFSAFAIY